MQKTVLKSSYVNHHDGITSGTAYDTAWAAKITDERGKLLFPECVQWLLENQKPDGSWGCEIQNYHDRVLSTLSAIIALREIGGRQYESSIKRGETYVWETIKNLELDSTRLIGSELLIPSLMEEAESLGLNLPYYEKVYQGEYNVKLKKIDESLWYSPLTPLSFSLEFLGDQVDVERLSAVQLPNGSVATSPAATAFFLRHRKDAKAFAYLRKILSITGNGSVMTVYPIEVFEYGWVLYNLLQAGLYFEWFWEICDFLSHHLRHSGLCWSAESPVASGDETAVVLKVLCDMQYSVDPRILDHYDAGSYYRTLDFELDPSVSTNIHVLDFVQNCSELPDREEKVEKLVKFLRGEMCSGFWIDKWHTSPYYPTSHAVLALCDTEPSLAEKAVSWILETQNEDGLWGENRTLEETAYAVQALMYYHHHVEPIDTEPVTKAVSASASNIRKSSAALPDLWIGKVLYTPIRVVWSSVASSHAMVQNEGLNASIPVHWR